MATKGHFKTNAASRLIIRHGKNGTTQITPETINEGDNFKWASENGYAHLLEENKTSKDAADNEADLTPKQKLQAQYKEVFGENAAEELTKADLTKAIAEKQNTESK